MWSWKPAKAMLELLWNHGELVVAGRQGFQRLYDLPERVIPKELLDAPTPPSRSGSARSSRRAVRARGALTESGAVEHWRLRGGTARIRAAVDALVDGRRPRAPSPSTTAARRCSSARGTELDRPAPAAAVLLSPFDNLLWDRPFARRVLASTT